MGRGIEMDVVAAFPDSLEEDPATFGVVGRAGIGKTTLWQAAIATACRCGHLAISSRPQANRPARSMRPEGNQDRASSALATTLRECHLLAAHNIPSSPTPTPPTSPAVRRMFSTIDGPRTLRRSGHPMLPNRSR